MSQQDKILSATSRALEIETAASSELPRPFESVPPHESLSREERANQLTHGFGLVLSLCGAPVIWQQAARSSSSALSASGVIFLITLVALYAASTLSHSFTRPRWREFFRTVDQVCIFLLIAGTFTPIAVAFLPPWMLWPLMTAVWACALLGAGLKLFVTGRDTVSLTMYLLAGWLGVLGIGPILQNMPLSGTLCLVAGGLCYTGGIWFWLRSESHPGSHALWHLSVIAGSCLHYLVVAFYALPS